MRCETAGWDRCNKAAASVTLPVFATARKVSSRLDEMRSNVFKIWIIFFETIDLLKVSRLGRFHQPRNVESDDAPNVDDCVVCKCLW